MAAFNKFECFVGDLGDKIHDLDADDLMIYLTNNLPDAGADSIKGDLAGATEENGYAEWNIAGAWAEAGGVAKLTGTDKEWTAGAGGFGPFRYAVLYNDTPGAPVDPLIGWWDYGSAITINEGEKFKVDFDAGTGILTVT